MSIAKWYPRKDKHIDKALGRFVRNFFEGERYHHDWWPVNVEEGELLPSIEFYDKADAFVLTIELPGVKKEDIELSVTSDTLKVRGEIKREEAAEGECQCSERAYGHFSRTVDLPSFIDTEKVDATCKDGILTIVLPKKAEAKSKEIKVKVA